MKRNNIKNLLLLAALGVLPAVNAWSKPAVPPSRGEYSQRDAARRPEGMRNNSKRQLEHFLSGVGFLEKSGKAKLSSSQAGKIVNLISPWRKQSAMSEAQAKSLEQKLRAVLTSAQTNELKSLRSSRRGDGRRGDDRRGDDKRRGGRDGERLPGGTPPNAAQQKEFKARMEKMRAFMKTYNPFYPPKNYKTVKEMQPRMQERYTRRYSQTVALLSQLSQKSKR